MAWDHAGSFTLFLFLKHSLWSFRTFNTQHASLTLALSLSHTDRYKHPLPIPSTRQIQHRQIQTSYTINTSEKERYKSKPCGNNNYSSIRSHTISFLSLALLVWETVRLSGAEKGHGLGHEHNEACSDRAGVGVGAGWGGGTGWSKQTGHKRCVQIREARESAAQIQQNPTPFYDRATNLSGVLILFGCLHLNTLNKDDVTIRSNA